MRAGLEISASCEYATTHNIHILHITEPFQQHNPPSKRSTPHLQRQATKLGYTLLLTKCSAFLYATAILDPVVLTSTSAMEGNIHTLTITQKAHPNIKLVGIYAPANATAHTPSRAYPRSLAKELLTHLDTAISHPQPPAKPNLTYIMGDLQDTLRPIESHTYSYTNANIKRRKLTYSTLTHLTDLGYVSTASLHHPSKLYLTRWGPTSASGIDHILCPTNLLHTIKTAGVDNTQAAAQVLSDHDPVLATIKLCQPLPAPDILP